ncbi:MAG: HD domain-containing protein [Actinomycetota bacterium]|nr:HD domain-containing protein [Actinomycetota bacterium]
MERVKTGGKEVVHEALVPPFDVATLLREVPELSLAEGQSQGPFHHLDTLGHTMEVVRRVEAELEERRLGARVGEEAREELRLVGLLHDIAKPVTRTEYEGRAIFVAHDTLGARLAYGICRRLDLSARLTDLVTTITALHLKIGFMSNERSDYPPERLVRAAGPFGEELAILCWADRLAAQGPRLKEEHIERHRALCVEFLERYRAAGPHPEGDYAKLSEGLSSEADAGYAASRTRLLASRGLTEDEARACAIGLLDLEPGS